MLDESALSAINTIVFGFCMGIFFATLIAVYLKRVQGSFMRALLEKNAVTPESAITLEQVGRKADAFIKLALRQGGTLRKIVKTADDESNENNGSSERYGPDAEVFDAARARADGMAVADSKNSKDMSGLRFYIPEEMRYRVELQYNDRGASLMTIVITFIAVLVLLVAASQFLPALIDFVSSLFSSGSSGPNTPA